MKNVFLSTPLNLSDKQRKFYENFCEFLRDYKSINPITVGKNAYTQGNLIEFIKETILYDCVGMIILALKKENTSNVGCWNQLEAGIALGAHMPIFRIAEEGMNMDGVFDNKNGLGPCEVLNINQSKPWLKQPSFSQTFDQWKNDVEKYSKVHPEMRNFFQNAKSCF